MNPPNVIDDMARRRAKGMNSMHMAWSQALATLPPLAEEAFERIARNLPNPATARYLAQYLSREKDPQAALEQFLKEVDESQEDLKAWLASFGIFAHHVESSHLRPGLRQAVGYLHCCEAVTHTGARYETMPMAVETMLATHGYEGVELDAQT